MAKQGISGDIKVPNAVNHSTEVDPRAQGQFNVDTVSTLRQLTTSLGGRVARAPQLISADGTYLVPAGVKAIWVEVVGGGGGGGGAQFSSPNGGQGGGGGSGGYCAKYITTVPGTRYSVDIGAGGAGGSTSGGTGGNGGDTVFSGPSVLLTAGFGFGGTGQTAGSSVDVVEGAGSNTSSGGDINIRGCAGTPSIRTSAATGVSGNGGDSFYGSGGAGNSATSAGQAGNGYGAGGAGGTAHSSSQLGGAGTSGVVIIWELT